MNDLGDLLRREAPGHHISFQARLEEDSSSRMQVVQENPRHWQAKGPQYGYEPDQYFFVMHGGTPL